MTPCGSVYRIPWKRIGIASNLSGDGMDALTSGCLLVLFRDFNRMARLELSEFLLVAAYLHRDQSFGPHIFPFLYFCAEEHDDAVNLARHFDQISRLHHVFFRWFSTDLFQVCGRPCCLGLEA